MSDVSPRVVARVVLTVVAVLAGLYLVYLLRKPIGWIVVAAFIAVAVSGAVSWLERYMKRGLAITLTYVGLLLVPFVIGAIVVPPIVREGQSLADRAPEYVDDLRTFVTENERLRSLEEDYDVIGKLQEEAEKLPAKLGGAANALADVGVAFVNSTFALVNVLILSAFMVAGGPAWKRRFLALQPAERKERLERTLANIGAAIGNYVAGALIQATIAGILTFIVLTILGVPFAAPLAVLTALLDLIPLVGATIGAVIIAVITLFNDFPADTIVWVIWAIVYQQLENNVIQPQIQRRAVALNPFLVLVSVLFGSTLFGVLGALMAIPVAASLQILVREWWAYRHEWLGEAPATAPPPAPEPPPAAA